MSTIEDEARAEELVAQLRYWVENDGDVDDTDADDLFDRLLALAAEAADVIAGYLAASRREAADTNPVAGVQAWMAADLSTALGHPDVTEENDGYRSWAEWWAHLIHQVKALRPQPSEADVTREAASRGMTMSEAAEALRAAERRRVSEPSDTDERESGNLQTPTTKKENS